MQQRDFKYLLSYILPVSGILGLSYGGYFAFMTVVIAYFIIPITDGMVTASTENLEIDLAEKKTLNFYFDCLLYVNVPLVFIVLYLFLTQMSINELARYEVIGMVLSTAIVLSTSGINVAHELGHKKEWYNQRLAQLLLLPSLYMHFFIEHNRGHHRFVSTEKDPASARKGEMFYAFWVRSVVGQWRDAWNLEKKRWKSTWVVQNEMIHFTLIQMIFIFLIYSTFGFTVMLLFLAAAILSFTQLELVNYIEHYGLQRKKMSNGRYEKVSSKHSWNSNHEVGRIVLYELTRHSDHHYRSEKKYQILNHHDDSPQLPYGYPSSMLISLIPPWWFAIMDERIPA